MCCSPCCSLLITFITQGHQNPDTYSWHGYVLAVVMFVTAVTRTLVGQNFWFLCYVIGMRLRTAMTGIVYRKVRWYCKIQNPKAC